MRALGRTGERVSLLCLGGWHIGASAQGQPLEDEAIRMMHLAIDEGVNFFDNAWDYNDGVSEEVMGKALAMEGKRDKVFLMTKNCERDYEGSMRDLEGQPTAPADRPPGSMAVPRDQLRQRPDWIFERALCARHWRHSRPVKFASSASPVTKIRAFI